jgi:hypothetical protein
MVLKILVAVKLGLLNISLICSDFLFIFVFQNSRFSLLKVGCMSEAYPIKF